MPPSVQQSWLELYALLELFLPPTVMYSMVGWSLSFTQTSTNLSSSGSSILPLTLRKFISQKETLAAKFVKTWSSFPSPTISKDWLGLDFAEYVFSSVKIWKSVYFLSDSRAIS